VIERLESFGPGAEVLKRVPGIHRKSPLYQTRAGIFLGIGGRGVPPLAVEVL
jgi:hypothetical protein